MKCWDQDAEGQRAECKSRLCRDGPSKSRANLAMIGRARRIPAEQALANLQSLPVFPHTSNDEEREAWAAHYPAGSFWVLTTRSTYDNLPEYRLWQSTAQRRAASLPANSTSDFLQAQSSAARPRPPPIEASTVFIPYFEETDSPSPGSSLTPAESLSLAPWSQTPADMPFIQPEVSPLATEFSGLMHHQQPQHFAYSSLPYRAPDEQYVLHGGATSLMPTQQPTLNVSIPQQLAFGRDQMVYHSAPVQASGGQFWSVPPPTQRRDMGSRTGSLLEELMGSGSNELRKGNGQYYYEGHGDYTR